MQRFLFLFLEGHLRGQAGALCVQKAAKGKPEMEGKVNVDMIDVRTNEQMSRRGFVKGVTTVGAAITGLGLFGCDGEVAESQTLTGAGVTEWDAEADVIVVGFGGAGASAAIHACDAGASVLILEKAAMGGGATAICGQAFMAVGSDAQRACGYEDSVDDAMKYFMYVGDGREELLRTVLEHSAEVTTWLTDTVGVTYPLEMGNPGLDFGGSEQELDWLTPAVPRNIWTDGIWGPLQDAVSGRDIEVLLSTPATDLLRNDVTGEILGVKSNTKAFRARKGVILAAGSFSRDKDMIQDYITKAPIVPYGSMTDDGDGIRLGCHVGGSVKYFGLMASINYVDGAYCAPMMNFGTKAPSIAVNTLAKRFTNEHKFYSNLVDDLLRQPDGYCYVINSGNEARDSMLFSQGFGITPTEESIELIAASTLDELASALELDPLALRTTVDEWNAAVDTGADTVYGRTDHLEKIEVGPYLAAKAYVGAACTFGGLGVDTSSRVLDTLTGEPVSRLYAVGVNSDVMGRIYPTCGTSVTTCMVTGMLAAQDAVTLSDTTA